MRHPSDDVPQNIQRIVTFVVLAGVFVTFAKEWLPDDLVALGKLLLLLWASPGKRSSAWFSATPRP
jgi:hypothetical protein